MGLYRLTWSHAIGVHWLFCRAVTRDSAEAWLRIYERDDGAHYVVADKPPRVKSGMESLAMHAATF